MQDEAPAASGFRQCCRRHWRVAIPALLAAIALSAAFAIRLLRPQLVCRADRSDKSCWHLAGPTRACTDCCKCQPPRTCGSTRPLLQSGAPAVLRTSALSEHALGLGF